MTPDPSAQPRSVEDHADAIARMLEPLSDEPTEETVPLDAALGRVTAEEVRSEVDLPLFRNSQMDGYAVRAADIRSVPVALEVSGDIPAGHATPVTLIAGTALRIMTGAPVPTGADAIVPIEDTELVLGRDDDLNGAVVEIRRSRTAGEYVRERGSDVHRGEVLVPAGVRLGPRHLAALAAAGVETVRVRARLRVGILTTGTELISSGDPAFGQVYDANGIALAALVEEAGATVSVRASSDDDPAAFERILEDALQQSDLVITSGGISKGAYEVVREVLLPRGADVTTVAMQPGGPQATAVVGGVPVIAFPGNPVSTQVSFVVFLRDPLRAAAGLPPVEQQSATLTDGLRSVPGRRQFHRGRLDGAGGVAPVSGPSSHLVAGMARADVLIDVPAESESVEPGASVTVWTL
ncbi:gephyrin-like molybdotransferase Glp [Leifsonia sp. fls2-241-R2A-40a]|uniref:molybdopterin molybdotransferase MoeA n=1 Tax=Leifsonia sp. fls2-241-R2A-40a TaxID=3040290 RepID=UPI00254FC92D|nr:gephyrin-like molybdotransferase Glp [Leifsonia sp. fls2-241-R2A-40a]